MTAFVHASETASAMSDTVRSDAPHRSASELALRRRSPTFSGTAGTSLRNVGDATLTFLVGLPESSGANTCRVRIPADATPARHRADRGGRRTGARGRA